MAGECGRVMDRGICTKYLQPFPPIPPLQSASRVTLISPTKSRKLFESIGIRIQQCWRTPEHNSHLQAVQMR
jgi:hypothetical protein